MVLQALMNLARGSALELHSEVRTFQSSNAGKEADFVGFAFPLSNISPLRRFTPALKPRGVYLRPLHTMVGRPNSLKSIRVREKLVGF
jgi:hypothetical protein